MRWKRQSQWDHRVVEVSSQRQFISGIHCTSKEGGQLNATTRFTGEPKLSLSDKAFVLRIERMLKREYGDKWRYNFKGRYESNQEF